MQTCAVVNLAVVVRSNTSEGVPGCVFGGRGWPDAVLMVNVVVPAWLTPVNVIVTGASPLPPESAGTTVAVPVGVVTGVFEQLTLGAIVTTTGWPVLLSVLLSITCCPPEVQLSDS